MLHKEAKRLGLATWSSGIGEARAILVMPAGMAAPQPSTATRQAALLVHRLVRAAVESGSEPAMPAAGLEPAMPAATTADGAPMVSAGKAAFCVPAQLSHGEVEEMIEAAAQGVLPPSPSVAHLIRCAQSALATLPPPSEGPAIAQAARRQLELVRPFDGRASTDGASVYAGESPRRKGKQHRRRRN